MASVLEKISVLVFSKSKYFMKKSFFKWSPLEAKKIKSKDFISKEEKYSSEIILRISSAIPSLQAFISSGTSIYKTSESVKFSKVFSEEVSFVPRHKIFLSFKCFFNALSPNSALSLSLKKFMASKSKT